MKRRKKRRKEEQKQEEQVEEGRDEGRSRVGGRFRTGTMTAAKGKQETKESERIKITENKNICKCTAGEWERKKKNWEEERKDQENRQTCGKRTA